jgi:hypothetical protein
MEATAAATIGRIGCRSGEFFIPVDSHRFPLAELPLICFSIDELDHEREPLIST